MSKKVTDERVQPVTLTDNETGDVYELDFNRDSVRFAKRVGFIISDFGDCPPEDVCTLFYCAFRKNHKNISREKTDKILDRMGGMPKSLLNRLIELYQQAALLGIIRDDDGEPENFTISM